MVKIVVVTAFPDLVRAYLATSVLGRGIDAGRLEVSVVDLRDHAEGGYRQIDDYSFGGGGMVLMAEPLQRAIDAIADRDGRYVVYPSPQGIPLHQELVEDMRRRAETKTLVIVCGHYEGIDERFVSRSVDLEVSLGDFVLTGGELPALAIVDAVSRLVDGVVGQARAVQEDSFFSGMLDHPHYTRPSRWMGEDVPEALRGGSHAEIEAFRQEEAVRRTLARRPDMIARAAILPYLKHGVYAVQLHPALDRSDGGGATAIDGMDVLDIARACRTYGIRKYLVVTPLATQREIVKRIAALNPDLCEAMKRVKTFASFDAARAWIEKREKAAPYTVATTEKGSARAENWLTLKAKLLDLDRPIACLFGTEHGLPDAFLESADSVLTPISGAKDGCNALSVRSTASVVFDRFFGFR